jgi:hypothetical protein
MFGVALVISGFAYLIGALCVRLWGPASNNSTWLCLGGGALILLGLIALFDEVCGARLRNARLPSWMGRLLGKMATSPPPPPPDPTTPPDPATPDDVAALIYDVAGKAFASQAGQWRDVRGRVATLATIGPAATAVIVATTSAKFDLLALVALVLLIVATVASIRALSVGQNYRPSVALEDDPPSSTKAAVLHLVLAAKINQVRATNAPIVKFAEELFRLAATSFLLAVLFWAVHAATNSHVLFTLS